MKVLCAPDSFKESIDAVAASLAMMHGVLETFPDAKIDQCPLGDGGEGTLQALLNSVAGQKIAVRASDVFGNARSAPIAVFEDGRTAYVESAGVIGVSLIPPNNRDVLRSSSFGVGTLIEHASSSGATSIVIGVGGTASNDGGCGMAQALGVEFYDSAGHLIKKPLTGNCLTNIARIDTTRRLGCLDQMTIRVACDVDNPLLGPNGASAVYAPQKGASGEQVKRLEDNLNHLAHTMATDLGIDMALVTGAGAGGGLGGGLMAMIGAELESGIDTVMQMVGFESRIAQADLCLTGEGKIDAQTMAGKTCFGVAAMAARYDVPLVGLVGQSGPGAEQILSAGMTEFVHIGAGLSRADSIARAGQLLQAAAADIVNKYA